MASGTTRADKKVKRWSSPFAWLRGLFRSSASKRGAAAAGSTTATLHVSSPLTPPVSPNSGLSDAEKSMIFQATRRDGTWYFCPERHPYLVTECGTPMEASACPACGRTIGGKNHRFLDEATRGKSFFTPKHAGNKSSKGVATHITTDNDTVGGSMGGDVTSTQSRRKVTLPPGYSQLHWMRLTQSGKDLAGLRGAPPRRKIPMAEVNTHNSEDDCWSVLDGKVYNFTPYMRFHPGGVAYLMMSAGADCTDLFKEYHPWVNGHGMLEVRRLAELVKCYVGELDPDSVSGDGSDAAASKFALDVNEWREFKLLAKQTVSQMTVKFTFELPSKKKLGLEIPGQHLKVRATIDGRVIERAYTPSSKFSQAGSFDLLVKVYPDGVMSSYLDSLEVGATLEMRGPHGTIGYPSAGTVTRGKHSQSASHLVMLAGGSGITPMLQLFRAVFESTTDTARITLLYSNVSLEHIIALDQLEPLASIYASRVQIHHFLTTGSASDKSALGSYRVARLDKELLEQFIPAASPSVAVFLCGPPKYEDAMTLHLQELGFSDEQVYAF